MFKACSRLSAQAITPLVSGCCTHACAFLYHPDILAVTLAVPVMRYFIMSQKKICWQVVFAREHNKTDVPRHAGAHSSRATRERVTGAPPERVF